MPNDALDSVFVPLGNNPLDDIKAMLNVTFVMKDGKVVKGE